MRGHIRERGRGTWAVVIELARSESGRRRQKWHTVKGTKRDAERELTRLLNDLQTGLYAEPGRLTVAAYLRQWLADDVCHRLSGRSLERYESEVRHHLIPHLGSDRLTSLAPLSIQRCYSQLRQNGRCDGKGGLSEQSVRLVHTVLYQALKQAVRWQLLVRNPAEAVEPPRPRAREMTAFLPEQVALLLKEAAGTRLYVALLLALATGMRRNEILALRWANVDLKAGKLYVRQSLEKTKTGIRFKEPKTAKGRRPIDLPQVAVEALVKHKGEQARARLELGPAYHDQDLIVCRPDGRPATPSVVSRFFRDLARRLDMPSLRFHDLRHTHATLLFLQGEHPKIVSERLGHSAIAITLDRYSHVLPDMQRETAVRLDETLRRAMGG